MKQRFPSSKAKNIEVNINTNVFSKAKSLDVNINRDFFIFEPRMGGIEKPLTQLVQ
jgi:hypothetical protein